MKKIYEVAFFAFLLVGNYLWIATGVVQWWRGPSALTFWLWWVWIATYMAAVFLIVAVLDERLPAPLWMKEDWEWGGGDKITPEFTAWLRAKQREVRWWYVAFPFTSYFIGWWLLIGVLCVLAILFHPWINYFLSGESFDPINWIFVMLLLTWVAIAGLYANR